MEQGVYTIMEMVILHAMIQGRDVAGISMKEIQR